MIVGLKFPSAQLNQPRHFLSRILGRLLLPAFFSNQDDKKLWKQIRPSNLIAKNKKGGKKKNEHFKLG